MPIPSTNVGRNDPCPCGSGKKYKHCCLRKDRERRQAMWQASEAAPAIPEPSGPVDYEDIAAVRQYINTMLPQIDPATARELQPMLSELERADAYIEMAARVEAAGRRLDDHYDEFKALAEDSETMIDRAEALFLEERFAHLRYTPEEIEQTAAEAGLMHPATAMTAEEQMELLLDLIVYLLQDEKERLRLSQELMKIMVSYVDEGRYLDGWLVQHSAFLLADESQPGNPFMFVMVNAAIDELLQRLEDKREDLLSILGIDAEELDELEFEEVEALIRDRTADVDMETVIGGILEESPTLRSALEAEAWQSERESLELLTREDAACLHLTPEEIGEWPFAFIDHLATQMETDETLMEPTAEMTYEAIDQVTAEMSSTIFTPARIQRLIDDLTAYRDRLTAQDDQKAARLAQIMLVMLKIQPPEKIDPAEHTMLLSICAHALRTALREMATEAEEIETDQ